MSFFRHAVSSSLSAVSGHALSSVRFARPWKSQPWQRTAVRMFAKPPPPVSANEIRNVAIIAHVDHGKTTLVDALLTQGGGLEGATGRLMDSNVLEKERGITILSKVTRIEYKGKILNIVDTPGHADFGGEVERILSLVDGVCLVVDVVEGPKTQTKFVLQKALLNPQIKPIVVINKCDRENSRTPGEVESEIFDLFLNLDASDEQMGYPTIYAAGKAGWAVKSWEEVQGSDKAAGVLPLLDTVIDEVSPPGENDVEAPFSFLVSLIENVPTLGITVTGKVYAGVIRKGDSFSVMNREGKVIGKPIKVKELTVMKGTSRMAVPVAGAGDIVSITGDKSATVPSVTDTLCSPDHATEIQPLPSRAIDPPVVFVEVSVNTSPLQGQDGQFNSMQALGTRLKKEAMTNVAIEVLESPNKDKYEVRGRGELQLGILLETMRREGYEMSIFPPTVVYKKDESGKVLEPWEELSVEVPSEVSADIISKMSERSSDLIDMKTLKDTTKLTFHCASRLFMGMRSYIKEISKNTGVVTSEFLEFRPKLPGALSTRNGALISAGPGQSQEHDLAKIQEKGTLFIGHGVPVYSGMVIGEHGSKDDMEVNCTKGKKLDNMRSGGKKEDSTSLTPPRDMPIEAALSWIAEDEIVEVTPKRIVIRKKLLSADERKRAAKDAKAGR